MALIIGCSSKIKTEGGDNPHRICAKCHNAAVVKAKSQTWFDAFCIPIFPMSSTKVYRCGICGWEIKQGSGFEPPIAGQQGGHQQGGGYPPQGFQPQGHPGMVPGR